MLDIYTYPVPRPPGSLDLSLLPLDSLAAAVTDICDHQHGIVLWFGYLDGWMLTPREEVVLRRAIRKFECHLVTSVPVSLSVAWQNELRTVYTGDPHGDSHTHHHGGVIHNGSETGHDSTRDIPAAGHINHQD